MVGDLTLSERQSVWKGRCAHNLRLPSVGARMTQYGRLSYWLGVYVATGFLAMAITFAWLVNEPISQRLVSVFVLGFVPGSAAYGVGCVALLGFRVGDAVYEPIAVALSRLVRSIVHVGMTTGRSVIWFATIVVPRQIASLRCRIVQTWRWISRTIFAIKAALAKFSRALTTALTWPIRIAARGLITLEQCWCGF